MSWLSPPADYDVVYDGSDPVCWLATTRKGKRVRITDAKTRGIPTTSTIATRVEVMSHFMDEVVATACPGSLHAAALWIDHYHDAREMTEHVREAIARLQRGDLDRAAFLRVVTGQLERTGERDLMPELLSLLVPEAS